MKRKLFVCSIFVVLIILPCSIYVNCSASMTSMTSIKSIVAENIENIQTRYIAHAGGSCLGYAGSNSMEALIESAKMGYTLIEVDIMQTTDGYYILNHDWELMSNRVAFVKNSPVNYKTFTNFKIYNKFTPVNLEDLINFLDEHKNIRIITDTKNRDYSVLYNIKEKYKDYLNRFIPQVYAFEDYNTIKKIGYEDVIITLYEMTYNIKNNPEKIYQQAKKLKPYAITIPDELLISEDYIDKLHTSEIKYFAHTINNAKRAEELFEYGISGIYTDKLLSMSYTKYYDKKIAEINEKIAELPKEYRNLFDNCLIYEYGSEICIAEGKAEFIYNYYDLISPFENPNTGVAFLPLERTMRYIGAENYAYVSESHSIVFEYKEIEYNVNMRGFYKQGKRLNIEGGSISLYDIFCVQDTFFTLVFDCDIIKQDGYIIVSKDKNTDINAIIEILQSESEIEVEIKMEE